MKRLVAVSGGADSVALALLLWERGEDFELMFADTGAELAEVYWLLPQLVQKIGRPLHVVSGGSFFQHLTLYGYMLPSVRRRWCTRVLKQAPQDAFAAAQGVEEVCIGIRADEERRQKKWRARKGGAAFTWPLVDAGLDKAAVRALCKRHDLLNPVYQWRSSVSCFCCPFQRKADWLGMLVHHPTLYAIAEEWEHQSARTTETGYIWSHWPLKQLREADAAQLRLLPEPDGEPCLICTA